MCSVFFEEIWHIQTTKSIRFIEMVVSHVIYVEKKTYLTHYFLSVLFLVIFDFQLTVKCKPFLSVWSITKHRWEYPVNLCICLGND